MSSNRIAFATLTLFLAAAASAQQQWNPASAPPTAPIDRSGTVTIAGTAPWGSATQLIQLMIDPGLLLYGPSAGVRVTNTANGPTVIGTSESSLAANYAWYAHGGLTGVQGIATATYLQANYPNKLAVTRGGFFAARITDPIPTGSQNSGPYQISGVTGQLDGTITNLPANGAVAGVLGIDNVNSSGTFAGYFFGKGHFTDHLTAYVANGDALATFSGNRSNGFGARLSGGRVGAIGIGGAQFSSGNQSVETFGLWGIGANAIQVTYGVHGDATGGLYTKGVAGSAYGAAIENYGVYGEVLFGIGYAGYFNGDTYVGTLYQGSDARLKENVRPLGPATASLMNLRPITYRRSSDPAIAGMHLGDGDVPGFIAGEVANVFPSLVRRTVHPPKLNERGEVVAPAVEFDALNYTALIPVLVKALQEQQAVIDQLHARIAALESR